MGLRNVIAKSNVNGRDVLILLTCPVPVNSHFSFVCSWMECGTVDWPRSQRRLCTPMLSTVFLCRKYFGVLQIIYFNHTFTFCASFKVWLSRTFKKKTWTSQNKNANSATLKGPMACYFMDCFISESECLYCHCTKCREIWVEALKIS